VAHEQRATTAIKIRLAQRERLVDAQPSAPQHDDQATQPTPVTTIVGAAHHTDDLLHGRRIGGSAG
jgi:hypothetical protein